MATFKLKTNEALGKIKPLHGVGQPPIAGGRGFSMFSYLTEAGIPYSRLHDVGGAYGNGRFVDIPNIFRNFDADETLPESYDFAFTDGLITALIEAKVEPFFRLGVTIENDYAVKAYNIYPPKDFAKWARICEHIIMHYTEGWANGFNYDIKYWEIWNEPDNSPDIESNPMWRGTKEQFYELYAITAKHLKARFPHLKIGGYASCGFYDITGAYNEGANSSPRRAYFVEFFDEFLKYIKKEGAPLDFFSWHAYEDSIENFEHYAHFARLKLDVYGFTETETSCNEWNTDRRQRGSYHHAAKIAAVMLAMQSIPLDSAMFYDARWGTSIYGSLFNPLDKSPFPALYAFTAFNRLYELGTEFPVEYDEKSVRAVGAKGDGGKVLVIANPTENTMPLVLEGAVPLYYVVTDTRGCDRFTKILNDIPQNSIVTVILA